MTISFPYLQCAKTNKRGIFAATVYRPIIPVRLSFGKDRALRFLGLIDSGADFCLFPAWIAEFLGHNLEKGKLEVVSGVGGAKVKAYLHQTYMEIGQVGFRCDSFYSPEFNPTAGKGVGGFGLLGSRDFFAAFHVELDYPSRIVLTSRERTIVLTDS